VGFSGWLNCYDPKPREGEQTQRQTRPQGQRQSAAAPTADLNDEIPW
jgi:hypothetical protein